MARLTRAFFDRCALAVAPELLGCRLVHERDGTRLEGVIAEVEAYLGDGSDPASHAHPGPTRRNASMFGPPGHLYVYRSMGIHLCANVVCDARGRGAAVLLRAAIPVRGAEEMRRRRGGRGDRELCSGPGKLTQAFGIELEHDGAEALRSELRIEAARRGEAPRVLAGPRIGIRKAADLPYRFFPRRLRARDALPRSTGTPRPTPAYHPRPMSAPDPAPLAARERFVRAARGRPVDRPPVWLMRQAGRYLPEYRELKSRSSFPGDVSRSGDRRRGLATALAPLRHGRGSWSSPTSCSRWADSTWTWTSIPARGWDDRSPPAPTSRDCGGDAAAAIAPTCEAIGRLRRELGDAAAVIGFAGAPWTLAAYASETRLSRDLEVLSALSWREPAFIEDLLEQMVEICASTLRAQIEAGADALQIFDTWAGMLDAARYERLAGAALKRAIRALPPDRPPVIVYARGAAHLTDALAGSGADVISLDWRVDLGDAARRLGARVSLQGNLEPTALAAPPEQIEREVARLIERGRAARGHIVNLGHGVLPSIPVEGVAAFVRAVQRSRS